MNSNNLEISDLNRENNLFFEINQRPFTELLTFVDFAGNQLNIGLVEINFAKDRDILIEALIKHPDCQNIQFEILDFPDPNLRFLRDELVVALTKIKIAPDKKLILLITGLEKSIGISEEYPSVLTNLNFVRDDLRISVPHPLLLFLSDYALTRLAKYAPDFWAWNRKVFCFKTNHFNSLVISNNIFFSDNFIENLELPAKQERIELLSHLLSGYNSSSKEEKKNNLPNIINIYNELGNTYKSLGDYQQAIDYHQQSLKIKREVGDLSGTSHSLNNLGNAYYSLRDYQRAIDYFQQSLENKREIGDRHGEANTWFNLGFTRQNLQQKSEAKAAYENARKLYQAMGLDKEVKDCDRAIQDLA